MSDPAVLAYSAAVAVVVAAHFAFIGYLVTGGFLAWRWPRTLWLHVPVVVWGVAGLVIDLPCPLTAVERWARAGSGMAPLPSQGFIAHYITGVWYPASAAGFVTVLVFMVVLTSWGVAAVRRGRGYLRDGCATFSARTSRAADGTTLPVK